MKVYIDNNVLVDIEVKKYSVEDFTGMSGATYYYSDAHINELLEAKGNYKVSQEGRLSLIVSVSAMLVYTRQKNIAQVFILERYFFVST